MVRYLLNMLSFNLTRKYFRMMSELVSNLSIKTYHRFMDDLVGEFSQFSKIESIVLHGSTVLTIFSGYAILRSYDRKRRSPR